MVAEDSLFRSIGRNGGSTTKQQRYHVQRSYHANSPPLLILPLLLTTQLVDPWRIALRSALSEWEADHQQQTTRSLIRSFSGQTQTRSVDLCLVCSLVFVLSTPWRPSQPKQHSSLFTSTRQYPILSPTSFPPSPTY